MAIMRGIENGYALARSTKEGISSISDQFGRIIISNNSGTDEEVVLLGNVYIGFGNTLYGKRGDLFVYLLILFLMIMIVMVVIKKGKKVLGESK
jgi:apolipoprotein N-acyltransferase